MKKWSDWRKFPDPLQHGLLTAPFGPGCYELRNGEQLVLYGSGNNVAARMSSLLPAPLGCGTRNNALKRAYVEQNLAAIDYRTLAGATLAEARAKERQLRSKKSKYLFGD